MPDWNLVNRSHVMAALLEHDKIGDRDFLRRYGYRRSVAYTLWHNGQEYDAKAIVGAACFHATGTAPRPGDLAGGKDGAVKLLIDLGLDVVVDEEEALSERPKAVKAPKRQTAAERAASPKVCPTCHMALPASGICDFCD